MRKCFTNNTRKVATVTILFSFQFLSHEVGRAARKNIFEMMKELQKISLDNFEFYRKVDVKEFILRQNFQAINELTGEISAVVKVIERFAGDYDLDETTLGNGYRSFVFVVELAVKRILEISKNVQNKRESVFFRKSFYEK